MDSKVRVTGARRDASPLRAAATVVAVTAALVGAAAITWFASSLQGRGPAWQRSAPATATVAAIHWAGSSNEPAPAGSVPASAGRHRDLVDRALRLLRQQEAPTEGPYQFATFTEFKIETADAGAAKTVLVRNKGGTVVTFTSPDVDGVAVVAGKRVSSTNYERAREYARQLRYDLSKDSESIRAAVSRPEKDPGDVRAEVDCVVVAPSNVRIAVVPG